VTIVDIDQTMTANKTLNKGFSEIGGASGSQPQSAPQSIVDVFVYSAAFPTNYWHTLYELSELYEKSHGLHLDDKEMLKLKLLSVLLVEQLLGQLSVNSVKVLGLMEEYDNKVSKA